MKCLLHIILLNFNLGIISLDLYEFLDKCVVVLFNYNLVHDNNFEE